MVSGPVLGVPMTPAVAVASAMLLVQLLGGLPGLTLTRDSGQQQRDSREVRGFHRPHDYGRPGS